MVSGRERAGAGPHAPGAPAHAPPEAGSTAAPRPHAWERRGWAWGAAPGAPRGQGQPSPAQPQHRTSPSHPSAAQQNITEFTQTRLVQSGRGLLLLLAVPEPGKARSWAELLSLHGDMGQPQGAWAQEAAPWAAPSPACAPRGCCPRSMPRAGGAGPVLPWWWRMPQVTGGALTQPQRDCGNGSGWVPEPSPASCPQPCQPPPRQSWGGRSGVFGGRGCAARPLSAAPAAAHCPFNREP